MVMMIVLPVAFVRSWSKVMSAVVSSAARPDVGSSRNRITGSVTSSSAMLTRFRLPALPRGSSSRACRSWRCFTAVEAEVLDRSARRVASISSVGVVGRQPELHGAIADGLEDGELGVDEVVLGDVADRSAWEVVVDGVEVFAGYDAADDAVRTAEGNRSARGGASVLPAPDESHQRDHVAGQRLEAHVVEEVYLVRSPWPRRDRAPRGAGSTPRSRRAASRPSGSAAYSSWTWTISSARPPLACSIWSGIGPGRRCFSPLCTSDASGPRGFGGRGRRCRSRCRRSST